MEVFKLLWERFVLSLKNDISRYNTGIKKREKEVRDEDYWAGWNTRDTQAKTDEANLRDEIVELKAELITQKEIFKKDLYKERQAKILLANLDDNVGEWATFKAPMLDNVVYAQVEDDTYYG